MSNFFWPYVHRVLTCEVFTTITVRQVERAFLEPRRLVLHTQRHQHHLTIHEMMQKIPRDFDWRELIVSASQFAEDDFLEQF